MKLPQNIFTLSKKEYEFMVILWSENREMSGAEVVNASPEDKSWKASSVFILLDSLQEKGAIKMTSFVKYRSSYCRCFKATLTEKQYKMMQIKIAIQNSGLTISEILAELNEDGN